MTYTICTYQHNYIHLILLNIPIPYTALAYINYTLIHVAIVFEMVLLFTLLMCTDNATCPTLRVVKFACDGDMTGNDAN